MTTQADLLHCQGAWSNAEIIPKILSCDGPTKKLAYRRAIKALGLARIYIVRNVDLFWTRMENVLDAAFINGGHEWPSSVTDEAWEFFESHPKKG